MSFRTAKQSAFGIDFLLPDLLGEQGGPAVGGEPSGQRLAVADLDRFARLRRRRSRTKAPATSAEKAKKTPDTARKNRRIFTCDICGPTSLFHRPAYPRVTDFRLRGTGYERNSRRQSPGRSVKRAMQDF